MRLGPWIVRRLALGGLLLLQACGKGAAGGSGPDAASGTGGAPPDGSGTGGVVATAGAGGASSAGQDGGQTPADSGGGAGAGGPGAAGAGGAGTAGGTGTGGAGGAQPSLYDDSLRQRAAAGMIPLQTWYDATTGLWDTTDWWTSANQLETVIDYSRETGDTTYFNDIDTKFLENKPRNIDRFGYYVDDGWWAIAWIKAYDLSHQQKYLDMAKTIFTRMAGGWDTKCGGGIYWASAKAGANGLANKNAIPNELFLQVAAKLHQRTPGDTGAGSYLDWAQREWTWFKGTGMLTAKNLVVDGLDGLTTCKATGPIFTYNTGVLVGALVDLGVGTGDSTLLDQANAIAHATMTKMSTAAGILEEAPCGGDICVQFKGVFMRNPRAPLRRAPGLRPSGLHEAPERPDLDVLRQERPNQFGYEWDLPFDKATASRAELGARRARRRRHVVEHEPRARGRGGDGLRAVHRRRGREQHDRRQLALGQQVVLRGREAIRR